MFPFLPENLKLRIHKVINCRYALILTYHSVVDYPLEFDIWTHISVTLFEEHMGILTKELNVVPLNDLLCRVATGNTGRNLVSVTFDDGFGNNFTVAYPILKKYNIPATIFLTTSYIDSQKLFWPERISFQLMRTQVSSFEFGEMGEISINVPEEKRVAYRKIVDYLKNFHPDEIELKVREIEDLLGVTYDNNDPLFQAFRPLYWKEIKLMEQDGLISFGGHSHAHPIFSKLSLKEAHRDIKACRRALDQHLLSPVRVWAYPNGTKYDFLPIHKKQLCELGFDLGILTAEPEYISSKSDVRELGRFGIGSQMNSMSLKELLSKRGRIEKYRGRDKVLHIFYNFLKS